MLPDWLTWQFRALRSSAIIIIIGGGSKVASDDGMQLLRFGSGVLTGGQVIEWVSTTLIGGYLKANFND